MIKVKGLEMEIVCLGCINKIHRPGSLNNRNYFFTVLEAGSLRSKYHHLGSGDNHLPGFLTWQGDRDRLVGR